ncbi:MAG: hypothetical protein GC180_00480 [Bacteroidetes bacterium]|nr:hypothetical protein [Bacteroidota bacterium]
MRVIFLAIGLFSVFALHAQNDELIRYKKLNIYMTIAPTITFGTRFVNGSKTFTSPTNKTGKNTIYPLYSVLDGYPNPQMTFWENFARKFSWGVLGEYVISDKSSFNLGLEVGARGYKLHSEQSVSSLISFRNIAMPIYFSRYKWLGSFWTLKFNYGGHLNYAYSIPMHDKVVSINRSPVFYPTVGGGIEMAYMGRQGKISFEVAYYHGWQNVIDQVYIGVDNQYGERITATGSNLRVSLKYNLKKFDGKKRRHKDTGPVTVMAQPVPDPFTGRKLKTPETMEVSHQNIEICFLDDQTVDGDSIRVMWNDSLIVKGVGLVKTPSCFKVSLKAGPNRLIVHALNEGKIPPNTYEIRITDGDEVKTIQMKSDMANSAVMDVYFKP